MKRQITILGGGYAGLLTALRLSRRAKGQLDIQLISSSETFVERVRLHQAAVGSALRSTSLSRLLAGTGVRFVAAHIDGLDLARGELHAQRQRFAFDELVLALGSRVDKSQVPGASEHAFSLDADAVPRLRERLQAAVRDGGRVVVCGGGLSGIELAAELCDRWPGLSVTLLSQSVLGPDLSDRARGYIRQFLVQRGVLLQEGASVQQIEPDAVWWSEGDAIALRRSPADVCIWAGGFVGSPLSRQAGLLVNPRDQLCVDAQLRSLSHPHISAVGDAAALPGRALQLSCKVALPMAAVAGDNLARRQLKQPEVPFEFSDRGVCISLGRRAGVIDQRWPDARPREHTIDGGRGAALKEVICRYTVLRMYAERSGLWPLPPLQQPPRRSASDQPQIAS
jgi:NADH:ubiquinone reductase (H+-translocating)